MKSSRLIGLVFAAVGLFWVAPAFAQELTFGEVATPVLVVDSERIFAESKIGARITKSLEARLEDLVAENRRIEAELTTEEQDLTEKREQLAPDAFRELADGFDAKVQRIRAEQDTKQRELQRLRDEERQGFLDAVAPILSGIARERGALLILERRTVLLSAEGIDITDEAIARIDRALSDFEARDLQDGKATTDETTPQGQ